MIEFDLQIYVSEGINIWSSWIINGLPIPNSDIYLHYFNQYTGFFGRCAIRASSDKGMLIGYESNMTPASYRISSRYISYNA